MPPLTNIKIQQSKPAEKTYALIDGQGLTLSIRTTGKKVWLCRFYIAGKAGLYTIGEYPSISLSQARTERERIKALAKQGINPNLDKKIKKAQANHDANLTFKTIAEDWYNERIAHKSKSYSYTVRRALDKDINPHIGNYPINDITSAHVYDLLKKVADRGAPVLALNIRQYVGGVFRYAASTGRNDAQIDPTALLKNAIERPPIEHAKALSEPEIKHLISTLKKYNGQRHICIAIELLLLMFCRTVEIRRAEWSEILWDESEWHIPAGKMKNKLPHIVPLSTQSKLLLKELQEITGNGKLLIPSLVKPRSPISATTINKAFSHMGYESGVISGHDFRATARTHLAGMGHNETALERQLAHVERNRTTRAYNHQQYLPERHKIMQAWADYIDTLR